MIPNGAIKDIVTTVIVISGVVTLVVAAEASLPVIAGIGATAAACGGVYQAATTPRSKRRKGHF